MHGTGQGVEVMPEWTFTIFEGADAGRQFTLGDRPLALGREPGRDVLLHDERVSRLHLRLSPGDEPLLADENSSNGTFVNGALVRQARLRPGDVITVGNTKIIFGASAPILSDLEEMRLVKQRVHFPGATTDFIPEPAEPTPALQAVRVEALLAELAAAIRPEWEKLAVRVHVEVSPAVESVQRSAPCAPVDARRLREALTALMKEFLEVLRPRPDCVEKDAVIALRGCADPSHGGMLLEIICIGLSIPQHDVREASKRGAFRALQDTVAAHAGALELLPAEEDDVLLRVRLPLAGSADAATVIRKP